MYYMNSDVEFASLLRTRKHNSYVLCQIFSEEEWQNMQLDESDFSCWSLVNYCLCRRQDSDLKQIPAEERIKKLIEMNYLPEMVNVDTLPTIEFINCRHRIFAGLVDSIWPVESLE